MLRVNPHTADAFLSKIDASLLGNQASFLLQPWINPWTTDFLSLVYFSYVFTLPGVALYFYLAKEAKAFRRIMMGDVYKRQASGWCTVHNSRRSGAGMETSRERF